MIWNHSRKGRISGESIGEAGAWVYVKLDCDHTPRMFAESNQGTEWRAGEIVTLRRSLLTEVEA